MKEVTQDITNSLITQSLIDQVKNQTHDIKKIAPAIAVTVIEKTVITTEEGMIIDQECQRQINSKKISLTTRKAQNKRNKNTILED